MQQSMWVNELCWPEGEYLCYAPLDNPTIAEYEQYLIDMGIVSKPSTTVIDRYANKYSKNDK